MSDNVTPTSGESNVSPPLTESPRFQPPDSRRDFLGLAAIWSTVAACVTAAIGAIRLPMPAVFPESNSQVKIGPPSTFPRGSVTSLPALNVWVFHDEQGLYAMSSVCTHLGCIASRGEAGDFHCPCHGSAFAADGKVLGGPAPKGLNWLALSLAPDGQLVVDKVRNIEAGTHFEA